MKDDTDQENIQQSMNFLQNCLQLQSATMGCLGKALDDVLDTSMTLALNFLLNRRDNFLKLCHRDVTDKDIARLRKLLLQRKNSLILKFYLRWSKISSNGARSIENRLSKNTEVIPMVPVLLRIPRKNSHKTGTRMLSFKIFVLKASKMTKTRDNLFLSTPTEALPEGVGARGSDYMEVSLKFPGSRLQAYWNVWESFKVHPRVVLVLRQGYCLPFKLKPPLTWYPTIKSSYASPVKQKALVEAIQQMVKKRAVVPVQNKNSLGFYSRLFLVPKPENKWRPVIDLSMVNTFLHVPTFKMETAEVIRASRLLFR